ncbi:MAG: PQQ-dependent sugar dehydrogenase [Chitinophagaceae bacterium]
MISAIIASAALAFSACTTSPNIKPAIGDTTAPVENKAPNADYKPAFAGQTRISGVVTKTPYEFKVLTSGLKNPWGIAQLPDGRFLITEKGGTMKIVTKDGTLGENISGVPAVNSAGQGGLLAVTIDPAFSTNKMIYWTFSLNNAEGNQTAVAKGKLSADEKSLEEVSVIYKATPAYKGTLHYGGRILFDKTGNIIFSTGERSDLETRPQAQWLNSSLGKVIRITTDGKAAANNPFEGKADARPELYTYGHRNVQGLAMHPVTGEIWESEFGPRGGDEINRLQPGKNYGWPTITYGIEYAGPKVGAGIQQQEGMEQPVYYWDPVVSPSGMTFYSSDVIPEWKNNLFVGALSGMHVLRLVLEGNKVVGEERLLSGENQRFRDVKQGADGALYAVTDQGRFYRISKK